MLDALKRIARKVKGHQTHRLPQGNTLVNNANLYRVEFDVIGKDNYVELHENAHLQNLRIYIRGTNHKLIIESNCSIKSGLIWFEDSDNEIIIREYTTIEGAHIAVTEHRQSIKIGKDCMLSHDIEIRNGDSHSIIDDQTGKRINFAKSIDIKDHVWIGAGVSVLKGVTLFNNSIVGTKSIVTTDVPENSIAVGSPAKVIRSNVNWTRERTY